MADDRVPSTNDDEQAEFGYGKGGVPLLLLLGYLSFLAFFTWYTLQFQLPDFLQQGPGQGAALEEPADAEPSSESTSE